MKHHNKRTIDEMESSINEDELKEQLYYYQSWCF